ncbi:uncharacterized protein LOC108667904 [Hyalella azteca]|uniref:Uncharacterized protein LOC108667904 n=1 Tax=Hyalella azteca TaxID=294128 RepID=A0A8B7NA83_HYAAZ|nr:uncharacterized protein LOC108667904 [Hyalella azteca]
MSTHIGSNSLETFDSDLLSSLKMFDSDGQTSSTPLDEHMHQAQDIDCAEKDRAASCSTVVEEETTAAGMLFVGAHSATEAATTETSTEAQQDSPVVEEMIVGDEFGGRGSDCVEQNGGSIKERYTDVWFNI